MNEACSTTQTALYTHTPLTDSDKAHIKDCADCQALQSALGTVDATYMIREKKAPSRFAKVMAEQVLEREERRRKILTVTIIAASLVVLVIGLQLIIPDGAFSSTLLIMIGAMLLALKATKQRRWTALGATCCLAVIVVNDGVQDPYFRSPLGRRMSKVWKLPEVGMANSSIAVGSADNRLAGSLLGISNIDRGTATDERGADAIDAFNEQVQQLRKDSLALQMKNQQDSRAKDHFEGQVTAIFGRILNRPAETEQKLDEALSRIDARTEAGASGTGGRQINGKEALGGAKAMPSLPQPASPPAPAGGIIPVPREEAARALEGTGNYKQVLKAGSDRGSNEPSSEAFLTDVDAEKKLMGHDVKSTAVGNAAFSFAQPAYGQIVSAGIAYSQNEAALRDFPKERISLEANPAQANNRAFAQGPQKSTFTGNLQEIQKNARLKQERSRTTSPKGADAPAKRDISEKKAYRNSTSNNELADDKAPSSTSEADVAAIPQPTSLPVTYLDPNGYWENTYHPGSPAIPLLLESLHKTIFPQVSIDQILNASTVLTVQNPVAAPLQGALGLAAHTDVPYLDKPGRVLLQVTLKGAERAKGNRPPLTIVVVIPDSKNIPVQEHKIIREMLEALEAERRVDDHIAIVTDETDIPVPFSEFRYGTLELFLKNLQQERPTETLAGGNQGLYHQASMLALGDEGTQLRERIILTIGHSGVTSLEPAYREIDSHVLQGGTASVLAVSDNIDLLRLSARGQGSYRVIEPSLPAKDQIRTELESYGAVVARALRLNVQLQPGVKLKEVIGSNKLSDPEVAREKAIEVATDKRIAQSLGIEADRGNDDPGIQILIPRFLSGDSHVVTLDLFVEQPGPIADISLKSKDLVLMRNETLHASVALPPYREDAGQINSIIAHNEYAQRLASVIRLVRTSAQYGDLKQGVALLQTFAQDLETYAPPSEEKTNTANLISNYIYFIQAMISSSQQGSSTGVREAVTASLDLTSNRILGNSVRRN